MPVTTMPVGDTIADWPLTRAVVIALTDAAGVRPGPDGPLEPIATIVLAAAGALVPEAPIVAALGLLTAGFFGARAVAWAEAGGIALPSLTGRAGPNTEPQLLTHASVNLGLQPGDALGWLTVTATREAWRLEARRVRDELIDHPGICERWAPSADEVAAQRARLGLVAEIPERPRRFLIAQALGYSHREIAAHERVSLTTTGKQIARGRRTLRALAATSSSPCS
jgi:hypothetical protein